MDNEKLIIIDREDSINGGSYTRITFRLGSFLYMLHGVTSTIDSFMSQQYEDLKLALAYSGPDKCQWNILYQNLDVEMYQTIICYRTPFPSICNAFYPDIESDGYLYKRLFNHINDHMKRKFLYQKLYCCLKNYQEKQQQAYTTLNECIDSYLIEHKPTEEEVKSDIEFIRKITPDQLKKLIRKYYIWLKPEDFAIPEGEDDNEQTSKEEVP